MITNTPIEVEKPETILIDDFLRDKDVASWFRGTSIFHLQGAKQLFNAIRDDTEQRTSHRVKHCLDLIGLEPMISSNNIRFLMRLSRGNDLAFLWFLMEMHYKNSDPTTYNVNEQLICSAICHLDMVTTLRELDRILPRGRVSRTKISHSEDQTMDKLQDNNKTRPSKYILPYFEKLQRPKYYGKPLTIDIPNFKVNFKLYADYADPDYIVANESNRWYSEYDFDAGRRAAYSVVREIISDIFDNFEAAKLKYGAVTVLCCYHKKLKENEENLRHELIVNVRDKCLKKYFGNAEEKKKQRLRRIRESFYNAIEQQLCEYRKQTTLSHSEVVLKAITSNCDVVDIVLGEEHDEQCRINQKDTMEKNVQAITTSLNRQPYADNKRVIGNLKQTNLKGFHKNPVKPPPQTSVFDRKYMQNYDYRDVAETTKSSTTFFHAPKDHKPYQFDYRKIFFNQKDNSDKQKQYLKAAFLEALDKDISTIHELELEQSKLHVAASDCANKKWTLAKHKYEQCENDERPLKQYPELGHYDGADKQLMDKMLADAFEYLRKNPKLVLAQLPEAHKLPMLREWIARRYGKVYSPRERKLSYRYSLKIFRALDHMKFDFPTPESKQLGRNQFVNYNCHNYLNKKIKYIKDKYYQRIDNTLMEQSRNYWFAMRGYLCSVAPPRETFYAYMPSRLRDMQRFRLWKSNEHRPDKLAWDRRMLAKNRNSAI